MSAPFYVIYALCCLSDILDGYAARKTNTASKAGEILDSVADFLLAAVLSFIFIPLVDIEAWMLFGIGLVAAIRLSSVCVGYMRFRSPAFLHTYANKAAGAVCVCFPVLLPVLGISVTAVILCAATGLSALEELAINITSKKLNRNVKGFKFRGSAPCSRV